ncbi:MAG: imidazole glycerol phosphate synthase subunit HisH [Candidatus Coatesbacteria bacterium]|nr:imidazole glycerol phosphate synthase subunit HisH [Candidatus Coatesbacteria bacterium]
MKIVIVNSGGVNISSVQFALKRLGYDSKFTEDLREIRNADRIILPGVGSAGNAMKILSRYSLSEYLTETSKPVLGICLGMQIMFEYSEENETNCLGIFKGKLKEFRKENDMPQIHMGWNNLEILKKSRLLENIPDDSFFYFIHKYYVEVDENSSASSCYSTIFSAVVEKDNFFGCQFHPEKSGKAGSKILENFIRQ